MVTPASEIVPDALHPQGFQVVGGSRIPLIMFGGKVRQGIDNRWHSHASIPKTVVDILGLGPTGIPRIDGAPSLAGWLSSNLSRPTPPAYGTQIEQPTPPNPSPRPVPPSKWDGPMQQPLVPLVVNAGEPIPAPTDGEVKVKPPKVPVAGA